MKLFLECLHLSMEDYIPSLNNTHQKAQLGLYYNKTKTIFEFNDFVYLCCQEISKS